MTINIICIHQGEDGTVCGEDADATQIIVSGVLSTRYTRLLHPFDHRFVPGRECSTCGGTGLVPTVERRRGYGLAGEPVIIQLVGEIDNDCPTCADSPVRGYLEVTA